MITVAAILSTYNRPEKIITCIDRLLQNETEEIQIKLFISDSSDDYRVGQRLKNKYPNIFYDKINSNIFWNKAMINSWKNSLQFKPKFFLLLNDDTFLYKNVVSKMIREYNTLKDPSIIVGATVFENKITYGGRVNSISESPITPNNKLQEVKYINGNCILINKSIFDKLGYLTSKYSHSLGDIDYGLRAKQIGIKSYLSGSIVGECEKNTNVWFNKKSFFERLRLLNSPKGVPIKEYFYFNYFHFGLFSALKFILATFVALFFPKLYKLVK